MFHELFHFVLVNSVRVASALLPAAPLLGQKLPSTSVVENPVLVHGAFADAHVARRAIAPRALGWFATKSATASRKAPRESALDEAAG